jgi:hypothetical protein
MCPSWEKSLSPRACLSWAPVDFAFPFLVTFLAGRPNGCQPTDPPFADRACASSCPADMMTGREVRRVGRQPRTKKRRLGFIWWPGQAQWPLGTRQVATRSRRDRTPVSLQQIPPGADGFGCRSAEASHRSAPSRHGSARSTQPPHLRPHADIGLAQSRVVAGSGAVQGRHGNGMGSGQ